MNWYERFLSKATLVIFIGAIVFIFAVIGLAQIWTVGVFSDSWDFSRIPFWVQALLVIAGGGIWAFEAFFLWQGRKNKKKRQEPANEPQE